jgi:ssDNA thymidine ADP-ribosyltransferase, DarT
LSREVITRVLLALTNEDYCMPGSKPNAIVLYRIVHIDNVEFILRNGMFTKNHANSDPNYINIGDSSLIAARHTYQLKIDPPGGNLGDYVPFYFGPLSPMLLNITTGYRGVTKRSQEGIVYICCKMTELTMHCGQWCFTDGHAKDTFTEFYNSLNDLNEVDWDIVKAKYWTPIQSDLDKMRRKQAEFLVKDHVPPQCIGSIIVQSTRSRKVIQRLVVNSGLNIPVHVNINFYY